MGASKQIRAAMIHRDMKPGELAERIGMKRQAFYNKMNRDNMKYSEVQRIADFLGCDVILKDRESGKEF